MAFQNIGVVPEARLMNNNNGTAMHKKRRPIVLSVLYTRQCCVDLNMQKWKHAPKRPEKQPGTILIFLIATNTSTNTHTDSMEAPFLT